MPVSQPARSSSIDPLGLPARVLGALAAVYRAPLASQPCATAFEEVEQRVRESVAARWAARFWGPGSTASTTGLQIERAGQRLLGVAATPKTIMSALGHLQAGGVGAEMAKLVEIGEIRHPRPSQNTKARTGARASERG